MNAPSGRVATLFVIAFGWTATVAISWAPEPDPQVVRLAAGEGLVYARLSDPYEKDRLYASEDGARSWVEISERDGGRWVLTECEACDQPYVEVELPESIVEEPTLPRLECSSSQVGPCFRIDGRPRVERSDDGGSTWRIIWDVPSHREPYALKSFESTSFFGPPESIQRTYRTETRDLIVLPDDSPGSVSGSLVIVAMGSEGVVRIEGASGDFERIGIGGAVPTPWSADGLWDAQIATRSEWLSIVLAALVLASVQMRLTQPSVEAVQGEETSRRPPGTLAWLAAAMTIWAPFAIGFGILPPPIDPIALLVLGSVFLFMPFGDLAVPMAGLAIFVLAALMIRVTIVPIVRYSRRLSGAERDVASAWRRARRTSLTTFGIVALIGCGAFVFWALGWIPRYWIAVAIALLASAWGIWRVVEERHTEFP